jgi:hypothetical protein
MLENGEKLKKAYSLVIVSNYDVKSEIDVLKIIKAVDPDSLTEEGIKLYSAALQLFRSQLNKKLNQK